MFIAVKRKNNPNSKRLGSLFNRQELTSVNGPGDTGPMAFPNERRHSRASCWLKTLGSPTPVASCTIGSSREARADSSMAISLDSCSFELKTSSIFLRTACVWLRSIDDSSRMKTWSGSSDKIDSRIFSQQATSCRLATPVFARCSKWSVLTTAASRSCSSCR